MARFEPGAPPDPDREWLRQLGLDVEARTPPHRTQVLSYDGMLFPMRCRTCGLIEGPKGATKEELQEFARAHEEAMS